MDPSQICRNYFYNALGIHENPCWSHFDRLCPNRKFPEPFLLYFIVLKDLLNFFRKVKKKKHFFLKIMHFGQKKKTKTKRERKHIHWQITEIFRCYREQQIFPAKTPEMSTRMLAEAVCTMLREKLNKIQMSRICQYSWTESRRPNSRLLGWFKEEVWHCHCRRIDNLKKSLGCIQYMSSCNRFTLVVVVVVVEIYIEEQYRFCEQWKWQCQILDNFLILAENNWHHYN